MTLPHLLAAAPFAPVDQEYLFEARQMQALSFAVHIPIVCFGIAFPAFVLMLEGLWLRSGDPIHRTIAKRWSKVMLALFAVGVVTGTILSFELGLLWPNFMATYGSGSRSRRSPSSSRRSSSRSMSTAGIASRRGRTF
jgi:cytochrome d ubiquinol oxidase subunit I